jgi:hypothetical protein
MKSNTAKKYQGAAISTLVDLTGKTDKKQQPRKRKTSKLAAIFKMARYSARACTGK